MALKTKDEIGVKKTVVQWHIGEIDETLEALDTKSAEGLSSDEVKRRQGQYGLNELVEKGLKSPWRILWEQLTAVMVVVLIVAAVISYLIGDAKDAIVIMIIVILNAALGFSQEYKAEQAMAALKRMATPVVRVRRDGGHVAELSARELVPGDIILLEAGSAIPADARLVESASLRVEEAALTGESVPVEKSPEALSNPEATLGDRHNMLYMGTAVTYGRGTAVIVNTGMNTELGHIATLIQDVESEPTPLQLRMAQLGKILAIAAVIIVAIVFFLGLLRGEDLRVLFLTAVSMAVAAVPEGLAAVVTIALALGSQRMLKRNVLIRKLPAVETLGSVTVICSDKTGTLTENRMTVTVLDVLGQMERIDTLRQEKTKVTDAELRAEAPPPVRSLALLLKGSALCNDAILERQADGRVQAIGDPTEAALAVAASHFDLWKPTLDKRWPRVGEAPFTSERKRMTTIHEISVGENGSDAPWVTFPFVAFTKGSVDGLLDVSSQVWSGESAVPLTAELRESILRDNASLAQQGQRVLGVAFRSLSAHPDTLGLSDLADLEDDLIFIGLVAMLDPARPEVKEAVATCRTAGIRPVMITGDHPLTASHIAVELGIMPENGRSLTGQDLNQLSLPELENIVAEVSVYARVSPEHKLNIVQALQDRGEIAAMTGDGVNDAPALKRANIGVAMGITGTDVSKEAADMVLLDDNFATIVSAVEEGRTIYDNVRKFIKYTLTSNSGEIYVMLFAPFFGMPLPLTPIQILWINLVTDGLPGLALAVEPPERDVMKRPPFLPNENIFGRGLGWHIIWVGLLMGAVSLGVGYWAWLTGNPAWQTMLFTTLTLAQMGHALAIRSGRDSLFTIGLLSNKALLGAVLLTFVLQLLVVYWGPLQQIFNTLPLSLTDLGIALALSSVVFWGVELEKWWMRRKNRE
jgi:P-type Ca2+ transporter type 2C